MATKEKHQPTFDPVSISLENYTDLKIFTKRAKIYLSKLSLYPDGKTQSNYEYLNSMLNRIEIILNYYTGDGKP